MKRVSGPSAPTSTRAMIRSTRLQLAAASKNSLKRRTLPSPGAASKRALALASRRSTRRRNVVVGAQQDLGAGPVGADRAQQPAQEGLDLLAARPLGGTEHGGDETARAVEHDDRLKAVFVIMGVEQPQLLAAVNRVERVVDVERDPLGKLGEGGAIEIDHGAAHAHKSANVRQILQPRDRRLRTQFPIGAKDRAPS